jgi:hypothetical protein
MKTTFKTELIYSFVFVTGVFCLIAAVVYFGMVA